MDVPWSKRVSAQTLASWRSCCGCWLDTVCSLTRCQGAFQWSLSRWWKSDDVATVAECCRDKALVLIGGVCSKDNSYSNAYLSLSPWSQLPYTWAIYNFGMLLGWMKMCQAMHTSYSVFHPLQVDSGCGCTRMLQNPSAQNHHQILSSALRTTKLLRTPCLM